MIDLEEKYIEIFKNHFKMNKYELLVKDKCHKKINDPETAHSDADEYIIDLLKELGMKELAKIYDNIPKWYA